MQTIGAFEAKTHLSAILAKVKKGEHFIITHRGEPIAEMRPVEEMEEKARSEKRRKAFAHFRKYKRVALPEGMTIKQMIEFGRR